MAGLLICLKGTVIVSTLCAASAGRINDLSLWLEKNVLKETFSSEASFILEERQAVWLPVGCAHVNFALCDKRPSKKLQPAAASAKKKGASSRAKKDDEDVKYGGMLFIPAMSEYDAKAVRTVGWTYQQVSRCSRLLPKSWSANTGLKDWIDSLRVAVDTMGDEAKDLEAGLGGAYDSEQDEN